MQAMRGCGGGPKKHSVRLDGSQYVQRIDSFSDMSIGKIYHHGTTAGMTMSAVFLMLAPGANSCLVEIDFALCHTTKGTLCC